MFINVSLLFMFIIIKNNEKSIHYNKSLRFFDITSKLKIEIVVYNIELISDESYLCIFNWSQNFLSIFSKLLSKNCVSHNITFIKNNIDNYRNKFFKFINQ